MLSPVKRVFRKAIRKIGVDIVRIREQQTTPRIHLNCTYLSEHRQATDFIPGMISPEAAESLYGMVVAQNVEGDVLEIGSWQGKSTSYLARAVLDSRNGQMFAIDHFMGNAGKENLYFVGERGSTELKARFESNMQRIGLKDTITLLPTSSKEAYPKLADRIFRFLFIDGDHTEHGVKKDIELFCPLVCAGGIIVFDDFNYTSPGVVLAVGEWVKRQPPPLVVC